MMHWHMSFYNKNVLKEIEKWPPRLQAKFIHITELLEKFGPFELGMPKIENFGNGLLQIRAKGKEGIGRAFFCLQSRQIIILHAYIKKTQKTPYKEIILAMNRHRELIRDG